MKRLSIKTTMFVATMIIGAIGLTACETVPYTQRVANYEGDIKSKFIGKSIDDLILAYGPPQSSYDLSDGRRVVQYSEEKQGVVGGETWMNYDTFYAGSRIVRRSDGSRVAVPVYRTMPYWETEPTYTYNKKCVQRFVVGQDKMIQDFKWAGNACFK